MATAVTTTTTQAVALRPHLKKRLKAELKLYEELHTQKKAIEAAMERHKSVVEEIRAETGEVNIELEGFKITRVQPTGRETLSKEKLLAQGVSMRQIENSIETKPVKEYTLITLPKVGE